MNSRSRSWRASVRSSQQVPDRTKPPQSAMAKGRRPHTLTIAAAVGGKDAIDECNVDNLHVRFLEMGGEGDTNLLRPFLVSLLVHHKGQDRHAHRLHRVEPRRHARFQRVRAARADENSQDQCAAQGATCLSVHLFHLSGTGIVDYHLLASVLPTRMVFCATFPLRSRMRQMIKPFRLLSGSLTVYAPV